MLCTHCHKNEAEVFFKQIANNKVTQHLLCRECAQGQGVPASVEDPFFGILAGLGSLFKESPEAARATLKCPSCGIQWDQFMETGRLGCAECYASFHRRIEDILKRIHGRVRHEGRRPKTEEKVQEPEIPSSAGEIERLRKRLKNAIAQEDFEEAARLRDMIRKLEPS